MQRLYFPQKCGDYSMILLSFRSNNIIIINNGIVLLKEEMI